MEDGKSRVRDNGGLGKDQEGNNALPDACKMTVL